MTDNIPNATELCRLIACIPTLESIVIKKEPFKVGRSPYCDFELEEKNVETNIIGSISKVHFEITKDPDNSALYITDLSKNGTFLNGTRLKKHEKKELKDGDIIALGLKDYNVFTFRSTENHDTAIPLKLSNSKTTNVLLEAIPWGHLNSCMMYLDSFPLYNKEFKVGRSKKCDVVIGRLNISQNTMNIFSKQHFLIFKDPDNAVVFIRDLSRAGTYLNGQLIGKNNTNVLQNDDEISIGMNKLKLFVYKCKYSQVMNNLPTKLKQKYEPSTLLGRSAAAEVRLAFEKFTCKMVAIKKIQKSKSIKIKSEINILQTVSHPCVISIKELVETSEEVYLVQDYMEGGLLTNRILSNTPMSESNVKFLFSQMVAAVRFLHSKGITHRDLNPENILLFTDDMETLLKVSDFGLSSVDQADDKMTAVCGTMNYIAPEVLDSRIPEYNKQVDVWSLGVILFYMLSKRLPFQCSDKRVLAKHIITGYYIMEGNNWDRVSASAKDLIKKLLNVDPQKRITPDNILHHPWLYKDIEMKHKLQSLLESQLTRFAQNLIVTYVMDPPHPPLKRPRVS